MARAGFGQRPLSRLATWVGGHDFSPVLPVAILDVQREGRTGGPSSANACEDARAVLLDDLAAATPVPALTATEPGVDVTFALNLETSWNAVEEDGECGAVRLARGQESKHARSVPRTPSRTTLAPVAPDSP